MSAKQLWIVVPAAGIGKRMNADIPKQYLPINDKLVISHTLERLLLLQPAGIVVAINPADTHWPQLAISSNPLIHTVHGGDERVDSVRAGLDYLQGRMTADDWVMVHDVARPCVQLSDMQSLYFALKDHPVGGILATPASDTLKQVVDTSKIEKTIDRSAVWAAQTPQMFRYGLLKSALEAVLAKGVITTDEAHAVELAGYCSTVVEGRRDNIKITRDEDLAIAKAILNYQQQH